ncbi:MAG: hypothetical protein WA126_11330 [Thermodesulfovibrionales bacterium]
MKKEIKKLSKVFLLFTVCYLLFACSPLFAGGINDRVVAFVNNDAITLSELEMKYYDTVKVTSDITQEEVLNTMVNKLLLLREAKKIRLEGPSEDELLNEYIDLKIRAFIRIKEEELQDFYNKNISKFEGKELDSVSDDIENYLVEHEVNQRLKAHINELREKSCVKIQLNGS